MPHVLVGLVPATLTICFGQNPLKACSTTKTTLTVLTSAGMFRAALSWFFPSLVGQPDDGDEEQEALELVMDMQHHSIVDPHLMIPACNFYHYYDHRSTFQELLDRFPDWNSNNWRSQFRFDLR